MYLVPDVTLCFAKTKTLRFEVPSDPMKCDSSRCDSRQELGTLDADKNWGQTICRRDIGLPRGFMFTGDFAKTIGRWLARLRCRSDDASRRAGEKLQRFWRPTIVISFCARSVSAS